MQTSWGKETAWGLALGVLKLPFLFDVRMRVAGISAWGRKEREVGSETAGFGHGLEETTWEGSGLSCKWKSVAS